MKDVKKLNLLWQQTGTVADACERNKDFKKAVFDAISLFNMGEWGNIPQEDKDANNADFDALDGRIVARYSTGYKDIYIITNDFVCATVLFCDEY